MEVLSIKFVNGIDEGVRVGERDIYIDVVHFPLNIFDSVAIGCPTFGIE